MESHAAGQTAGTAASSRSASGSIHRQLPSARPIPFSPTRHPPAPGVIARTE